MDSAQILHRICAVLCYFLLLLNNTNPTLLLDYAFTAVLIWRRNFPAFPAIPLHPSKLEIEQLTTTEVHSEPASAIRTGWDPDSFGPLNRISSVLEALPNQLNGERFQLYCEITAFKPIFQYQHPPSQGSNTVLKELCSQLAEIATKLELYPIDQSWPFSSAEQQSILLTLSRLKLALLSSSDASTVAADGNGMNGAYCQISQLLISLTTSPDALDTDPIQRHSGPGRTLHFGMQGNYIGNARDVFSNNIINEADPAVGQGVDELNDREYDKERAKQRREVLQWISPLDFHSIQAATLSKRTEGTGTWLLQNPQFLEWMEGKTKLLWCSGGPGVGKTILASTIIDHLASLATPGNIVIYIYCQYDKTDEQTLNKLLGSILKQLMEHHLIIPDHLLTLYSNHSPRKTLATLAELMGTLRTELKSHSCVYLIVDALDECVDTVQQLFLSTQSELRSLNNLQLLMTSRQMQSITEALRDESTIYIEAHDEDLQTYIQARIAAQTRLKRLMKADRSMEDEIIEQVIKKAAGMFLQAHLHLDSLARQVNKKGLREALNRLPEDISSSYDNAMLRIDSQEEKERKLAYQVFYWLTCSQRPLTVLELQHAVVVSTDPEMTDMDLDAIVDIETLIDVCAGLVIIDDSLARSQLLWDTLWDEDEIPTVRLVHYTMQEYFQLNQQTLFPDIQSLMAITCLTYMSFNAFSTKEWKVVSRRLFAQYPLYEYAVLFWGKHACDNQEQIFPHVQRFLQKPENVGYASKVFEKHLYLGEDLHSQLFSHILNLFIVMSSTQVIKSLLPNDGLGPADATLLHSFSLLGDAETMMALLTKVDINTQDNHSRTALSYSAEYGQLEIVQILLESEVTLPDLPDHNGCTPFIHACHAGHVGIVQLFLDRHDVNHNLRDYNGWTALFHAVGQEHVDVAQILLQHSNIQPDIPDNTGKTPLIWIAQQSPPSMGYLELMVLILDVNPDSQDEHLCTALSYISGGMCHGRFDDWIRYKQALALLKKGATADLQDKYLRTPLSYAIESHQSRIIKLLLETNAVDHYSPNLYLHTPISYNQSINNWSPSVERLLEEFSELKVKLNFVILILDFDDPCVLKKNHLAQKSDAQSLLDSSRFLIAASLDKVRDEGAWTWGFNTPKTQDQYTNNLDVLFLDIVTPLGSGFHGSIHNPAYGRYKISPNKQGVYYEVRILEMEDAVGVGLACRPYPPWSFVGWSRLSAAWHLDDMKKFFDSGLGEEYLPDTKLQNGDIVGVGFIHISGTVFFTLNGSRLPYAFTDIFLPHSTYDLFAAIGICDKASIKINFGAEEFMWSEGNGWAWSVEGIFNVSDHSEEGTRQSNEL
ncbi:hypothetical protein C8J56DRAFT_1019466 [Mycena floridula]|nr:hypothetical protein C8J56DRAFT_1019466 [Mycena floridula]